MQWIFVGWGGDGDGGGRNKTYLRICMLRWNYGYILYNIREKVRLAFHLPLRVRCHIILQVPSFVLRTEYVYYRYLGDTLRCLKKCLNLYPFLQLTCGSVTSRQTAQPHCVTWSRKPVKTSSTGRYGQERPRHVSQDHPVPTMENFTSILKPHPLDGKATMQSEFFIVIWWRGSGYFQSVSTLAFVNLVFFENC